MKGDRGEEGMMIRLNRGLFRRRNGMIGGMQWHGTLESERLKDATRRDGGTFVLLKYSKDDTTEFSLSSF